MLTFAHCRGRSLSVFPPPPLVTQPFSLVEASMLRVASTLLTTDSPAPLIKLKSLPSADFCGSKEFLCRRLPTFCL